MLYFFYGKELVADCRCSDFGVVGYFWLFSLKDVELAPAERLCGVLGEGCKEQCPENTVACISYPDCCRENEVCQITSFFRGHGEASCEPKKDCDGGGVYAELMNFVIRLKLFVVVRIKHV